MILSLEVLIGAPYFEEGDQIYEPDVVEEVMQLSIWGVTSRPCGHSFGEVVTSISDSGSQVVSM